MVNFVTLQKRYYSQRREFFLLSKSFITFVCTTVSIYVIAL